MGSSKKQGHLVLPTVELIDQLQELLKDSIRSIEIGAGAGNLGRFLNIPMTDAMIQGKPEIAAYYKMIGQPTINYPQEVDHLEAMDAVRRYHPWTVVASWVTQLYKTNFEDAPIHYDRSAMGCQ